jgi:hypothetical protein
MVKGKGAGKDGEKGRVLAVDSEREGCWQQRVKGKGAGAV